MDGTISNENTRNELIGETIHIEEYSNGKVKVKLVGKEKLTDDEQGALNAIKASFETPDIWFIDNENHKVGDRLTLSTKSSSNFLKGFVDENQTKIIVKRSSFIFEDVLNTDEDVLAVITGSIEIELKGNNSLNGEITINTDGSNRKAAMGIYNGTFSGTMTIKYSLKNKIAAESSLNGVLDFDAIVYENGKPINTHNFGHVDMVQAKKIIKH